MRILLFSTLFLVFVLLILPPPVLLAQNRISTQSPCNDSMALYAKGSWIKTTDLGTIHSKEAFTRMDAIHELVRNVYPQPKGVDATWHRTVGKSYFGSKRKYSLTTDGRVTFDYYNLPHFFKYYYTAGFFRYSCEYNKTHSLLRGYPGETGTWLGITANDVLGPISDTHPDDPWTIDGLPVRMKAPVFRTIRGYELQYSEPGSASFYVLIHRKGMLPYQAVSRRLYLEQCIKYHSGLYDNAVKAAEQMPVRSLEEQEKEKKARLDKFQKDFGNDPKRLKSAVDYYLAGYKTDQQIRQEQVNQVKDLSEQELKKFTDEMEKTRREGLLDAPAMILQLYLNDPVFETDPLKASMVVTENPNYIRKDLPNYIPQVFAIYWRCNDWPGQKRICGLLEENFPFEKLEAMIDK